MILPSRNAWGYACLASLFLVVSTGVNAQDASRIRFSDVTSDSGLDFIHRDGSSDRHFLIEVMASGMASFDYDLDGLIDVYFLSGAELTGTWYDKPPTNCLFRNLGHMKFRSVAQASGLGDLGFGLGVAIGDLDNDGFPDVYITNAGENRLYRNNGDGTFSSGPLQSALSCRDKAGGGCSMLDIEGDGDLDIYAASYMHFDESIPASTFRGRTVYGGPLLYPKAKDDLLINDGMGKFQDGQSNLQIDQLAEWGMGTICLDYDADGDTDIFVANDSTKNFLWTNDGSGTFSNTALLAGVAYDYRGDPQGSMGVDAADFNGDLTLDVIQTAYTKQLVTLYENMAGVFFQDATLRTGVGANTHYPVNWGTGFSDFDNDGDQDIFISNGHIHDNMDDLDDTVSYKILNQVLENLNGKSFREISLNGDRGLSALESSRGCAIEDLNNDGLEDIVVLNSRTRPTLLHNQSEQTGNWVSLDLIGIQCNRSAVGSSVRVTAGGKTQLLEVHSGRGYQSHFGSRLHFGLAEATEIDRIEIQWHGSQIQSLEKLQPNTHYIVREGHMPFAVEVSQ